MLKDLKNFLMALVLWLTSKPARAAVVIAVFAFFAVLLVTAVLMPEASAIAAGASSGGP